MGKETPEGPSSRSSALWKSLRPVLMPRPCQRESLGVTSQHSACLFWVGEAGESWPWDLPYPEPTALSLISYRNHPKTYGRSGTACGTWRNGGRDHCIAGCRASTAGLTGLLGLHGPLQHTASTHLPPHRHTPWTAWHPSQTHTSHRATVASCGHTPPVGRSEPCSAFWLCPVSDRW